MELIGIIIPIIIGIPLIFVFLTRLITILVPRWGPPPQPFGVPQLNALAAAKAFLLHEFQLLPPHSQQVRCLTEACDELRSTLLSTLCTFVEEDLPTIGSVKNRLESVVEATFRGFSSQEVEVFKELLVDGICSVSGMFPFCCLGLK